MFRFDRQVGRLLLGVAFLYGFVATDVAVAQVGTGSVSGTVSDASGGIVAGASISVKNTQTGVATPVTAKTPSLRDRCGKIQTLAASRTTCRTVRLGTTRCRYT